MRPLAVVTGILLGSCVSIVVSLTAVILVFLILGDDYPRLGYEIRGLLSSFAIFTVLTSISAMSFYAILKSHPMIWLGQAMMWSGVLAIGFYYWP